MSDATTALVEREISYQEERGKPMPSLNHGIVQMNLGAQFLKSRDYRVVSEVTLHLAGKDYTPDLAIFPQRALDLAHDISKVSEPPLTVVEIFSPQQGYQEVMDKVDAYLANGVKSVWIVSPPLATVSIRTSDGHQESFVSGLAKDPATGLTAELSAVFS